jgi:hypothetical protein
MDLIQQRIQMVSGQLAKTLSQIKAHARLARVYVVGYPDLLPSSGNGCANTLGMTTGDIVFLNNFRYTDIVILGCAVVTAIVAWRLRAAKLPAGTLCGWLATAAVFGVGVAIFDYLVYGGTLTTGYRYMTGSGEITFGLGAIGPNLHYMPAHLMQAMPMLVFGLAALAWIIVRGLALRRVGGQVGAVARRDLWVGLAVAASWFTVWAMYSAYYWTNDPSEDTLQAARFYVPALGAISLLGAWLVTRIPGRGWLVGLTSAAVVTAMFGLGAWSFHAMVASQLG